MYLHSLTTRRPSGHLMKLPRDGSRLLELRKHSHMCPSFQSSSSIVSAPSSTARSSACVDLLILMMICSSSCRCCYSSSASCLVFSSSPVLGVTLQLMAHDETRNNVLFKVAPVVNWTSYSTSVYHCITEERKSVLLCKGEQ